MDEKKENKNNLKINKLSLWQGVSGLLAVLLVISLFTGGFGMGSSDNGPSEEQNIPDEKQPEEQELVNMAELVDDDEVLGPDDAKVTIVEFSDFECPYCAAATGNHESLISRFKSSDPTWEAAVPKLKELAEQGKIRFVYRDFPLSIHKNAQKAAEAAECAGEQGKFWEMHDALFENGVSGGVDSYKEYAADLGLDAAKFGKCLDSGDMAEEVNKDFEDGQQAGVRGTPAFFVNGQLISGAQPFSAFEQVIEAELAK